jgi:uncharacterized protein YggE
MTISAPGTLLRLSLLLLLTTGYALAADTPASEPAPRITVNGSGEAFAPAARARLTIGIQTQALTAAMAGADGARLAQAVSSALRTAGLPTADLKSTHLLINPQWIYDNQTRQRRHSGYQADTTLIIDTPALDKLGAWVDAALTAGATNVSDPTFEPADEIALRRLAVSRAVQNARGDAEAMATAAGGALGDLLQLNGGQIFGEPAPVMRTMAMAAPAAGGPATNIVAGDIHVAATVSGVWRFLPRPGAPTR